MTVDAHTEKIANPLGSPIYLVAAKRGTYVITFPPPQLTLSQAR